MKDARESETSALVARLALLQADHTADIRRILSQRPPVSSRLSSDPVPTGQLEWSDLALAFRSPDWNSAFAACEFTIRVIAQAYRKAYELLLFDRRARKLIARHFDDCQQALDLIATVRRQVRQSRVFSVTGPLPLPVPVMA